MTDEEVEKIIKQNMNLTMNLAGIRADFEAAQQRTWVGLTDDEFNYITKESFSYQDAIDMTQAKLKEKNT